MVRILMLGSGPNATEAQDWPRAPFDLIVTINNAWRVRPDWDYLVCPEDFPPDRRPAHRLPGQKLIEADAFVPAQNALGGFVYAGGTMAFTASYWALHALKPRLIAYLGCDMVYAKSGKTHFYGTGTADPLRADISLRSLEAKSARLLAMAARQGCALVNLSHMPSRLVFPRADRGNLTKIACHLPVDCGDAALKAEAETGYFVASGRYWLEQDRFDPTALDAIDKLWLSAVKASLPP